MEIIERSQIFNDNFKRYIKGDTSNYLGKLLEFAVQEDDIELTIEERTQEFQSELLKHVLSQESKDDYETDIDEVRKERIENALYDISNYLMSIEPYDAIKMFIEGSFKELFLKSSIYCDSYRKQIIEKVETIKKITEYEYSRNLVFKDSIDIVLKHMNNRTNETIMYETMAKEMININKETTLNEYNEYVDSLLLESSIISKFNKDGRVHITNVINKTVEHPELGDTQHYLANICESVLINYVLLDLYSTNPESLIVTDRMLESIAMEINMGSVTKEDIIQTINNGPVEFTKEEIEYINNTFMNRLFHSEEKTTVNKVDLLKLVK